jgi:hypothetical protein
LTLKLNVIATLVETQFAGTRRHPKRPASPLNTSKSSTVVAVPATKNNPNSFILKNHFASIRGRPFSSFVPFVVKNRCSSV